MMWLLPRTFDGLNAYIDVGSYTMQRRSPVLSARLFLPLPAGLDCGHTPSAEPDALRQHLLPHLVRDLHLCAMHVQTCFADAESAKPG